MTEAYPLSWPEGWQRTPYHRRTSNSRFKTTFAIAHAKLSNNLRQLGAKNVVVSSWLPLTNAGKPRADAARMRIVDPGVAVYFTLRDRPMVMARDVYTNVHDNLHSTGHALEHLRGMERHGGANMMDRAFAGFAALPAPGAANSAHWSRMLGYNGSPNDWAALSSETQSRWIDAAYRERAKSCHPDAPGGSERAFHDLQAARTAALANVGAPRDL